MRFLCPLCLAFVLSPFACFGASKEIVELQRDVALLQDQLRTLQRSLDEKTAALQALVQQTLDSVNRSNTSVAVMENQVTQSLKGQSDKLVAPIATLGAKIDQMSSDSQALRETLADLSARVGKMQQQLVDLKNQVAIIQTPPAVPPPAAVPTGPPPGTSAESLYNGGVKDQLGGNYDQAMKEFSDYLAYFGTTEMAPYAQFHLGEIYNRKGDTDNALKAFDAVLEKYPDNPKTPDALLAKGMVLVTTGQRNEGVKVYRDLISRFPNTEQASKARAELKKLGLSAAPPAAAARKKQRK